MFELGVGRLPAGDLALVVLGFDFLGTYFLIGMAWAL